MGQKGRSDTGNSVAHNALSVAEETAPASHRDPELRFQMLRVKEPGEGLRERSPRPHLKPQKESPGFVTTHPTSSNISLSFTMSPVTS